MVSPNNIPSALPAFAGKAGHVASHLRTLIRAGQWREGLPGERQLAKELGVGRRSLRSALAELEREGVVGRSGPRGARVRQRRKRMPGKTRSIALLAPVSLSHLGSSNMVFVDELRRIVYGRSHSFITYESGSSSPGRYFAYLKHVAETARHDCWVLLTSTPEIQDWCVRRGLPVVLAATHYRDITLPSVDVDHRALCRHAAGEILRCNHSHVALILPRNELAGDVESRLGFIEGISKPGITHSIHHHNETVAGLCRMADQLLAGAKCPTAWLVCRTEFFLTVFSHLQRIRTRIPQDVSLVCRDSETLLGALVPEPTRYVFDACELARHAANLAFKVAAGQDLHGQHRLIMPEFVKGRTLGPPPAER